MLIAPPRQHAHVCACTYQHTRICTCVHVHTHVDMPTNTHHIYTCASVHTCARPRARRHTNTRTCHKHTNTQALHYGVCGKPKDPGRGNGKNQGENCMRQCLAPSEKAMECVPSNLGYSSQVCSGPAHPRDSGSGHLPPEGTPTLPRPESQRLQSSSRYQPPDQG